MEKSSRGGLLQVEPYYTPEGCQDFPFAYVFDATGLTDGSNAGNLSVPLQGDADFILRHIAGVDTCVDTPANGGKFNYKNASGSYANGGQSTGIIAGKNWPVVPEKLYPFSSQIYFDLFKVLRNANTGGGGACAANPILNSYIAFFGVKRFQRSRGYPVQKTPYAYREKRYSYEYPLTISVGRFTTSGGNIVTPPIRQVITLDNFDFELLRISISQATTPAGQTATLTTNDFRIHLYDANMHQLSNHALNQGFINSGKPAPNTQPPYQGVMPVPSLVYPAGGNIVFDVTSMLCAGDAPRSYNLSFEGVWRIPC